jgi:ferrochelatase
LSTARSAVVLVNTGTPAAPRAREVRTFLRRFLSDPRVVELPRALWLPLLNGVILPIRSPRSARNYRRIWTEGGSPLAVFNARLAAALGADLESRQPGVWRVAHAYLYSEPGLPATLESLRAAGVRRIVLLPLYPQGSGTTTGATHDQLAATLRRWRALPSIRFIGDYHDLPAYIDALAAGVREHWPRAGGSDPHLLLSFHGIPRRLVANGDDYERQCQVTGHLLAERLGLAPSAWSLSFQSRFGSAEWLGPATDARLRELAAAGTKRVAVACPGFAVDCLETLEEIAIGGREIFLHAGGEQLDYLPALNDRADHAAALAQLVLAGN